MIYMFLADGFEEIEALATLDVLRRAEIEVLTVGVLSNNVVGTHNIKVEADITLEEVDLTKLTGVILPGGMPGTTNIGDSSAALDIIMYAYENSLLIGAICAAPSVLGKLGLLSGKKATCYPGFEEQLIGATLLDDSVVQCDNIITSKGAGASFEFAFKIVETLKGIGVVEALKRSMQCPK